VRDLLWRLGEGPLFPVEVTIDNEPSGRPVASAPGGRDVRVSIAHKDGIAVAMASEGRAVGIDVERVEARGEAFAAIALTRDELRLVDGEMEGPARDEGWTRLWCAKEAAAKAAGTGLGGAPHRFPVRDRAGTRLLVGERWVDTKRHGDFVIGWTTP
jgi:phosphopantetheinyl transferase